MQVSENKISIKDATLIGGFIVQMAVTYGIITTKLDNYEDDKREIKESIKRMDDKLEKVVWAISENRQSRGNRD
jgi:hypothetical protein